MSERDIPGLKYSLRKLLAHARHMIQVATQVVDHHFDPIFRNGLLVFIQRMTEGIEYMIFYNNSFNCSKFFKFCVLIG